MNEQKYLLAVTEFEGGPTGCGPFSEFYFFASQKKAVARLRGIYRMLIAEYDIDKCDREISPNGMYAEVWTGSNGLITLRVRKG